MIKRIKDANISYWAAHFTTIVSVTLLLLLIGVIALLGIAAGNTADEMKRQQQVSIIMRDSISNEAAASLARQLQGRPYVNTIRLITSEQALADWNETTGEDVAAIAGGNFFTPEVELTLTAPYATPDSIAALMPRLRVLPGVDEVVVPDPELIKSMDQVISRTLFVLGIVAAAMIIISFVLINNTVLLTIYSRRFTIHTMQLVGATPGFIRRPFVKNNLLSGVIAALIACVLLGGLLEFTGRTQLPELHKYISDEHAIWVGLALIATGIIVCVASAYIATNRYLHKDYDELFLS